MHLSFLLFCCICAVNATNVNLRKQPRLTLSDLQPLPEVHSSGEFEEFTETPVKDQFIPQTMADQSPTGKKEGSVLSGKSEASNSDFSSRSKLEDSLKVNGEVNAEYKAARRHYADQFKDIGFLVTKMLDSDTDLYEYSEEESVRPRFSDCPHLFEAFDLVEARGIHGRQYIMSSKNKIYRYVDALSGNTTAEKFTWMEARNECRKHCMELVTIDDEDEQAFLSTVLRIGRSPGVWTSGRICNGKFCKITPDMEPMRVNGWLWSGTGARILPANVKSMYWRSNPWSRTGKANHKQPDNYAGATRGLNENCLALLNNLYKDGVKWHDLPCSHKMDFLCEESEEFMDELKARSGV